MIRTLEPWNSSERILVLGHFLGGSEEGSHWNVSAAVWVVWVNSSLSAPACGHVDGLGLICSVWFVRHSPPENHNEL